jgi:hypothetical protein
MPRINTNERVVFRLFRMPCCGHMLCWVNPRLPTYCPECGTLVLSRLRTEGVHTMIKDEEAMLKYDAHTAVIITQPERDVNS